MLLACGADIGEINTVRKHLSVLKGGGTARLAAPADLHALILSDVLGDDLSTIASGPTTPDPTTYHDAIKILKDRRVWDSLPPSVAGHLQRGVVGEIPETPKLGDPVFAAVGNTLVGSNAKSLAAVRLAVGHDGRAVHIYDTALSGEARYEAERLVIAAGQSMKARRGRPFALISGGETTVTLRGTGRGGRNQEAALAFAIAAEHFNLPKRWVFLSASTDGRDGPTGAAGGLVDPWSLTRMRQADVDPIGLLENNDSYTALKSSGDLLRTGATGTNVADLQLLLVD